MTGNGQAAALAILATKKTAARLTARQGQAAELLAAGAGVAKVAEAVGVSGRTVRRWRALPHVQEAVRQAEAERLSELARRLTVAAEAAHSVIMGVLADEQANTSARLRAAGLALQYRGQFAELVTLAERIARLEQTLAERGF